MLTLDLDGPKTATGGGGKLPPIDTRLPFMRPRGLPNGSSKPSASSNNNQQPIISTASRYPKPRAWVEKRISLCTMHHARFLVWRKANIAKLRQWVESQPGYDSGIIAQQAYTAKLRRQHRQTKVGA